MEKKRLLLKSDDHLHKGALKDYYSMQFQFFFCM
jgi:hypothetical protein